MAIKRTQWKNHVCGCVISYDWDNTTSENTRQHTVAAVQPCATAHPMPKVGEVLETSAFMADYLVKEKARVAAAALVV